MEMNRDALGAMFAAGAIPVNGRSYSLHPMRHLDRRQMFGFFTEVLPDIENGRFGWLSRPEFSAVEALLWKHVSLDGAIVGQTPTHWDEYADDYLELAVLALAVMSYPFLRGVLGGSGSRPASPSPSPLRKPTFPTP